MTKTPTTVRELMLQLSADCLVAAERYRKSTLPGADRIMRGLLADADRYAAKAEVAA